jgi:uncharacterized membrane protein
MFKNITCINFIGSLVLGITFISSSNAAPLKDSLILYTPYTKIAVPPGQSIGYSIDFINNTSGIKNADISLSGLPKGWISNIKSGEYNIGQIAVLPGEKRTINLKVDVPLNVNKGTYRFYVVAGEFESLPLTVVISEQGSYKSEFTSNQPNMQGNSNSKFTFTANLSNRTAESQTYSLMSNAPRGWSVIIKSNYQQVSSVIIEANNTQTLTIEIKPSESAEAGKYKIPLVASTNSTSVNLELEVVVTGNYSMSLSTPTGLLSSDITAGNQKRIELVINNTGTAELKDINLNSTAPVRWEVTFDPRVISNLAPGKNVTVSAIIKADKKAIPGDYVTNIEAKTPETSSKISFRISVETSLLLGWIGVVIIIFALSIVYFLFRKYGRR